jgi:hypothetical protein
MDGPRHNDCTSIIIIRWPILMNKDILAPGGRFYLVAVEPNKPLEIVKYLSSLGLQTEVSRRSIVDPIFA